MLEKLDEILDGYSNFVKEIVGKYEDAKEYGAVLKIEAFEHKQQYNRKLLEEKIKELNVR